jgi:hypothetical protein
VEQEPADRARQRARLVARFATAFGWTRQEVLFGVPWSELRALNRELQDAELREAGVDPSSAMQPGQDGTPTPGWAAVQRALAQRAARNN